MTSADTTPVSLAARTPEDLLAVVPVVLGFEPRQSVVMLTFGGAVTFHARVDLPPPAEADAAVEALLEPALRHQVVSVVFVVYDDDGPAARAMVRLLCGAFGLAGIKVLETLRAHDGRWFAPGGPPDGVPFDIDDHRFRAEAVLGGLVVHGSRDELAATLRPRTDAVEEVAHAVRRALPSSPGEIADLVDLRLEEGRFTTVELARILLGLLDPLGREAALAAMAGDPAAGHARLWTDAVQRAPHDLVATPAALLALAAWLAGHGALAWCAVDRSRAATPGNRLAGLVADLLSQAVPPSAWTQAR